jgi:hypothetical protein
MNAKKQTYAIIFSDFDDHSAVTTIPVQNELELCSTVRFAGENWTVMDHAQGRGEAVKAARERFVRGKLPYDGIGPKPVLLRSYR